LQLKSNYNGKGNLAPAQYYKPDAVLQYLIDAKKPFRVEFRNDLYPPNMGNVCGLETLNSYSATAQKSYRELVEVDYTAGGKVHNLLNIKYVVGNESLPLPRVFEAGGKTVFENPEARPRAWLVRKLIKRPDTVPLGNLVRNPAFDPADAAIIPQSESVPSSWKPDGSSYLAPDRIPSTEEVQYTRINAQNVHVRVTTRSPALLVLSEVWYPGWHAKVNGIEEPILRVNGTLRGVFVNAGESLVVFSYLPTHFYLAAGVGLTSFLLLLGFAVYVLKVKKELRKDAVPSPVDDGGLNA
jgi:hypothetical protein